MFLLQVSQSKYINPKQIGSLWWNKENNAVHIRMAYEPKDTVTVDDDYRDYVLNLLCKD